MDSRKIPFFISDVTDHTMSHFLHRYIAIKMHHHIDDFHGDAIVVRGRYERDMSIISHKEKSDKLFNWKRPTAHIDADASTLYINCFPGVDYVTHYASLIKTYLVLNGINKQLLIDLPDVMASHQQLIKTNIMQLPEADIIILGKVDYLFTDAVWHGNGDFLFTQQMIGGKRCLFVGCAFSMWGDIAGAIVSLLARKAKAVLYIGKLGGLHQKMCANQLLATGHVSVLHDRIITWNNVIQVPEFVDNLIVGDHITLSSPIMETKQWLKTVPNRFAFVDPEIGHMAYAAQRNNIDFGYLHIISDNVAHVQQENLSNERDLTIAHKRATLSQLIMDVVIYSIERYVM